MPFEWKNYVWEFADYRLTALQVELNHEFRKSRRLLRAFGNVYPIALDCRRFRIEPVLSESMVSDFIQNINMVTSVDSITNIMEKDPNFIFYNETHLNETIANYENILQNIIYLLRCAIFFYNTNGLNYVSERIVEYGDFIISIGEAILYLDDLLDKLNVYIYMGLSRALASDIIIEYI